MTHFAFGELTRPAMTFAEDSRSDTDVLAARAAADALATSRALQNMIASTTTSDAPLAFDGRLYDDARLRASKAHELDSH